MVNTGMYEIVYVNKLSDSCSISADGLLLFTNMDNGKLVNIRPRPLLTPGTVAYFICNVQFGKVVYPCVVCRQI